MPLHALTHRRGCPDQSVINLSRGHEGDVLARCASCRAFGSVPDVEEKAEPVSPSRLCREHLKHALDQRNYRDGKCEQCMQPVLKAETEKRLRGACLI